MEMLQMINAYKSFFDKEIVQIFEKYIVKIKTQSPRKTIYFEINSTRQNSWSGALITIKTADEENITLSVSIEKNGNDFLTLRYDLYEELYDNSSQEVSGRWLRDEAVETIRFNDDTSLSNEKLALWLEKFDAFAESNVSLLSKA
jgi:hypothetical protein